MSGDVALVLRLGNSNRWTEIVVVLWSFARYLADGDDENREDEDRQGHPGHVGFEAPGLCKVPPTLINTWSHF